MIYCTTEPHEAATMSSHFIYKINHHSVSYTAEQTISHIPTHYDNCHIVISRIEFSVAFGSGPFYLLSIYLSAAHVHICICRYVLCLLHSALFTHASHTYRIPINQIVRVLILDQSPQFRQKGWHTGTTVLPKCMHFNCVFFSAISHDFFFSLRVRFPHWKSMWFHFSIFYLSSLLRASCVHGGKCRNTFLYGICYFFFFFLFQNNVYTWNNTCET